MGAGVELVLGLMLELMLGLVLELGIFSRRQRLQKQITLTAFASTLLG